MINLMKNTFYKEEETKKALCEFIRKSEKLSMGLKCKEFEKGFSEYQGRKYSVLYNSGSSANLALIQSLINLGILEKGDSVGFSALTWPTNVMPLIQLGLNPIPIDVSLENLNVNLTNLKKVINHKSSFNFHVSGTSLEEVPIKALFITNLLGFCGDLDKIKEYCREKRIILLEDNCESLGSELKGTKLGNFGLASTFSFFVGHHLSTIEGGMVCTDDKDLYEMLLMVREHGWTRSSSEENKSKLREKFRVDSFYERYTFYSLGYNIRPTEITGFLGCEQLKYLNEICTKRYENFLYYENMISENPDLKKLNVSHINFVSNFAYPLIFNDKETLDKNKKIFEGIEIRPIVGGFIVKQPFFKVEGYLTHRPKCPNAEKISEVSFYIPNNPDLTEEELEVICELLK